MGLSREPNRDTDIVVYLMFKRKGTGHGCLTFFHISSQKQLVGLEPKLPFVLAFDSETRKMIATQKALLKDVA
jgi:hypothetical protein